MAGHEVGKPCMKDKKIIKKSVFQINETRFFYGVGILNLYTILIF